MGAPAATLRRLQHGGSPDNSGAAGKSLFVIFFPFSFSCSSHCVQSPPSVSSLKEGFKKIRFRRAVISGNGAV